MPCKQALTGIVRVMSEYNGSYDGEQEWMRGLGIWGNDSVTFVSSIGNRLSGGADAPKAQDLVYVLFDKKFLFKVGDRKSVV